jgi:hypothetical protein
MRARFDEISGRSFSLILESHLNYGRYIEHQLKEQFQQLLLDGNLSDGIRELIPLQDKRDLLIAAPLAIIDGHKQMDSVGK